MNEMIGILSGTHKGKAVYSTGWGDYNNHIHQLQAP